MPLQVAPAGEPAREVDRDRAARRARPGRCADRRGTAARAAAPPCRTPPPPRRRWWRPAARRSVVTSSTRSRLEWPPLTSSARHGSGSGPCSSWSTATCEARWLTPYSGLPEPDRERLGRGDADQQRTGEARTAGHRDRVEVVQPHAGGLAGPLEGRHHRLEVRPAGHLRYDAAEAGVLLDAAGHRVGEQGVPAHDPDTGLVARRLDAEDEGLTHEPHCARGYFQTLHVVDVHDRPGPWSPRSPRPSPVPSAWVRLRM